LGLKSQKLKTLLKTLLGLLLLVWVLKGKMVDFALLKTLVLNPLNLLTALVFLSTSTLLCTSRWLLLVKGQGLSLRCKDLLSLYMIGNFFNTFMPGSVGGDLIKAWYIAGKEPQKRTKAVFTVLLDRVLGLSVIIFYAAFTIIIFFPHTAEKLPQFRIIALCLWCFTGFFFLGLVLFFSPFKLAPRLSTAFFSFLRKSNKISKILDAGFIYKNQPRKVLLAIFISALSILSSIIFHSLQGQLLGASLTLAQYFVIVPLAATVSAIPLLPGGIGTGQVAFFTLFKWMGIDNPEVGGTLCTLIQIYTILFNCLGYFFYLKFKKTPLSSSTYSSPSLQML